MGPYCRFCDRRCFVERHIPYKPGTRLFATCSEGMAHDRERTGGYDHRSAHNPIYRAAVYRGALLLDRSVASWWVEIDLDKLDLANLDQCVLGQVYGSYTQGLDALGVRYGAAAFDAIDHGFDAVKGEERPHEEYGVLTREWRYLLRSRLANGAPS